jgi:hypothetical protein
VLDRYFEADRQPLDELASTQGEALEAAARPLTTVVGAAVVAALPTRQEPR